MYSYNMEFMVMATDLDCLKKGLDKFNEDRSVKTCQVLLSMTPDFSFSLG